jgi:hypothetical protein
LQALGKHDAGAIDRAGELITSSREDGQFIVYLGHYPVLGPDGREYRRRGHCLSDLDELLGMLNRQPPDMYLHGHRHQSYRAALHPPGARRIEVFGCGTTAAHSADPAKTAGYFIYTIEDGRLEGVERRILPKGEQRFVSWPEGCQTVA